MDKPRIGFVGVGLMGHGIAKNLVNKGFPLAVRVHRNRKPLEDLLAAGATEVKTNGDLARGNDIVILCVTGAPQVEEVVFGENGIASAAQPGLVVIDTSTSEPSTTARMQRPMRREISRLRESVLPVRDSRPFREPVEPGNMPYSPVTHPLPELVSHGGTPSSTHAVQRTFVRPNETSTEPFGWSLKCRTKETLRISSSRRPSGRMGARSYRLRAASCKLWSLSEKPAWIRPAAAAPGFAHLRAFGASAGRPTMGRSPPKRACA